MSELLIDPRIPIRREVLRLAVPATLGMLSQWLMGLADVYMIGRLAIEGTTERGVAAIANVHVASIYMLAMAITFAALSIGTQAVAARRWGEGNRDAAARALTSGLALALVLSAVLLPLYQAIVGWVVTTFSGARGAVEIPVVAAYLRIRFWALPPMLMLFAARGWFNGVGRTAVVMVNVLLVNGLNILLNWFLIEGHAGLPRLEERGAALASCVATYFGLAHVAVHALAVRAWAELRLLRHLEIDTALLGRIVRLSIPSFIHLGAAHTGFLIFLGVIVPMAREGRTGVAASGIVWNSASICFFVSLGFGIAAATLLGQGLGSGQVHRAVRGVWVASIFGWGTTMSISVGLVVFGRLIASLFTDDPEVISLAFWLYVIVASFQFLDNFGIVLSEAFKGAGMTLFVMAVEVPVNLVLFLGLSYWWAVGLDWGVLGAWAAMIVYAVLFALIMIVAFRAELWRRGRA